MSSLADLCSFCLPDRDSTSGDDSPVAEGAPLGGPRTCNWRIYAGSDRSGGKPRALTYGWNHAGLRFAPGNNNITFGIRRCFRRGAVDTEGYFKLGPSSECRRVGEECVSRCKSRVSVDHLKNTNAL